MNKKIIPFNADGAWLAYHRPLYENAYELFYEFRRCIKKLEKKEKAILAEFSELYGEDIQGFIQHKTYKLRRKCFGLETTIQLFVCMTFEAFLNFYGVKRFGEKFYKNNFERLGISEKASFLYFVASGTIISKDHPLVTKTRALFDERNRLVHPKTKEIVDEKMLFSSINDLNDSKAKQSLFALEEIIEIFCICDSSISRNFEFGKGKKI